MRILSLVMQNLHLVKSVMKFHFYCISNVFNKFSDYQLEIINFRKKLSFLEITVKNETPIPSPPGEHDEEHQMR